MPQVVRIRVDIEGVKELDRAVLSRADRLSDMRPAWQKIIAALQDYEERMFDAEGAIEGLEKWAPLSDAYAAWKAIHYPGRGILVRTGALKASLTGGGQGIRIVKAKEMVFGTAVPYGIYHQSRRPRRKLPRRAFLRLSEPMKDRIMDIVEDHLRGGRRPD